MYPSALIVTSGNCHFVRFVALSVRNQPLRLTGAAVVLCNSIQSSNSPSSSVRVVRCHELANRNADRQHRSRFELLAASSDATALPSALRVGLRPRRPSKQRPPTNEWIETTCFFPAIENSWQIERRDDLPEQAHPRRQPRQDPASLVDDCGSAEHGSELNNEKKYPRPRGNALLVACNTRPQRTSAVDGSPATVDSAANNHAFAPCVAGRDATDTEHRHRFAAWSPTKKLPFFSARHLTSAGGVIRVSLNAPFLARFLFGW